MTRWLLAALAFVLTLFVTPKLHALYLGSLPLTDLIESQGGERRLVRIAGGETVEVVVHHKEKWSQCPGLGVAAQARSMRGDSLVLLTDALFRAFRDEAAKEPPNQRCLTVTLDLGAGRQDPMNRRETLAFSLWRRQTDQRWILFTMPSSSTIDVEARRMLRARWPKNPQS